VLRLALKDIDNLPPNQTAVAWTIMLRLLSKDNRSPRKGTVYVQGSEQLEQQLDALFQHTMNSLDKMKHRDLTTVILSIAKIVKSIREANQTRTMNVYHQALESLLQKSNPFGHFATAADRKLIEFDPRSLSNLAYAYALVGHNPKFDNNSNLLQKIGDRAIISINQFLPQNLANLVWVYATLDERNASLLEVVGDHIVQLDDFNTFKPQELSNILWAYATLNQPISAISKKIGDHVVQSDDLAAFKPQALANIVWAYAKLNVRRAALFKKVGDRIVQSDDLAKFKPQAFANILWSMQLLMIITRTCFRKSAIA
jgi:hypothetical protein